MTGPRSRGRPPGPSRVAVAGILNEGRRFTMRELCVELDIGVRRADNMIQSLIARDELVVVDLRAVPGAKRKVAVYGAPASAFPWIRCLDPARN